MMIMSSKFLLTATALVMGIASVSMPASAAKGDRDGKRDKRDVAVKEQVVKYETRSQAGHVRRGGEIFDRIDARQARQANRIQQGIRSGELTRREAARLKEQQAYIRELERKAERDGRITPAERARIRAAQNAASRAIFHEKNDAQERGRRFGYGPRFGHGAGKFWHKRWFWAAR